MTLSLESLAARLAELEAKDEIRELKSRYLRALDLKQIDALRETLLPDGAIIEYEGFPAYHGREGFVEVFQQMGCQPGVHDIHHGGNAIIAIEGADAATGQWSLIFQSIILPMQTIIQMGVQYDDRYVRQDGRWYIAETRTKRTSCLIEVLGENGSSHYTAVGEAPAVYGEASA